MGIERGGSFFRYKIVTVILCSVLFALHSSKGNRAHGMGVGVGEVRGSVRVLHVNRDSLESE